MSVTKTSNLSFLLNDKSSTAGVSKSNKAINVFFSASRKNILKCTCFLSLSREYSIKKRIQMRYLYIWSYTTLLKCKSFHLHENILLLTHGIKIAVGTIIQKWTIIQNCHNTTMTNNICLPWLPSTFPVCTTFPVCIATETPLGSATCWCGCDPPGSGSL